MDAREITMYPTVSSVGMEDRKKYTRTQASSRETVCSTCGMKYDRQLYRTCPLCESRKKNSELETYIENIKTENARLNKEICKTEKKQESNINDSKREVGKTPRDNKGELQSKELSVSEFKKSIDYKIVVNRAYFKEKEEGNVSDDFIQSELDKLRLDKKSIGKITVEDVRNDMRNLTKRQADKKMTTDSVASEKTTEKESKDETKSNAIASQEKKQGVDRKTIIIIVESAIIIVAAAIAYFMFYSSYVEPADLAFMPKWGWGACWILELLLVPLCVLIMIDDNEVVLSVIYVCAQIITFYIAELFYGGACPSWVVFIRVMVDCLLNVGIFYVPNLKKKHSKIKK